MAIVQRWIVVLAGAIVVAGCSSPQPAAKKEAVPEPRITQFYASPPVIPKGETGLLCYGVENAPWVKLDPPVETLSPSLTRCFSIKPDATTTYTLEVPGARQTVRVEVGPPGPPKPRPPELIRLFVADKQVARPGEKVTLCYGVLKTTRLTLSPGDRPMPISERRCFTEVVARTTTFVLRASGPGGATDAMQVTVKVE